MPRTRDFRPTARTALAALALTLSSTAQESRRITVETTLGGEEAATTLVWTAASTPRVVWHRIGARTGPGVSPEVATVGPAATHTLTVPRDAWCLARSEAAGHPTFTLIAPASSDETRSVELAPERREIAVLVLGLELSEGIPNKQVALDELGLRPGQVERSTATTDEHGIARFRDLGPGRYVLRASGVEADDGPPHVASIVLTARSPATSLATLVETPARVTVAIETQGLFAPPAKGDIRHLMLRSIGLDGRLIELPGFLRAGTHTLTARVPPGDYRIETRPYGHYAVHPEQSLLRVATDRQSGTPHRVQLDSARSRSLTLVLASIDARDYPLQVVPLPASSIGPSDLTGQHFGPYRWSSARARAPVLAEPLWLAAIGGRKAWLSTRPLEGDDDARLPMRPATRLVVQYFGDSPTAFPLVTATVADTPAAPGGAGEGGDEFVTTCALRPALLPHRGVRRPGWIGEIVVPHGAVVLECDALDGTRLWETRAVTEANGTTARVIID